MEISIDGIGKRFGRDWVIKNLNAQIANKQHLAITGNNGSGKSTLLMMISGLLSPTEGKISYHIEGKEISRDDIYSHLSICAPYQELPGNLTLGEVFDFHTGFKSMVDGILKERFLEILELEQASSKLIRDFSSGMKQRTKLALAVLSDVSLILLDEPTTNLDLQATSWYQRLCKDWLLDRTVLVCTNRPDEEAAMCDHALELRQ